MTGSGIARRESLAACWNRFPIDPADYEVTCMGYEQTPLKRIFVTAVCDWSRPGVEQTEPIGTWLRFNAT